MLGITKKDMIADSF